MVPDVRLLLCCLVLPLRALDMFNPDEVEYFHFHVTATAGGSVALECGSAAPNIFIWGFTKPGSDTSVAVAHNYGHGPWFQPQSDSLGRMEIRDDTSALVVEDLQRDSAGTYTCQALYDAEDGTRLAVYSTRLDVEDN